MDEQTRSHLTKPMKPRTLSQEINTGFVPLKFLTPRAKSVWDRGLAVSFTQEFKDRVRELERRANLYDTQREYVEKEEHQMWIRNNEHKA